MKDDHLVSVEQLAEFIKLGNTVRFKSTSNKEGTYELVDTALGKFRYNSGGVCTGCYCRTGLVFTERNH
ncbi:MAG: hypothetical protein UY42_C0016G0013 [Parcubacteria group bacterium GW2011_GWA2_49_16]|nr:MAG: hypothetical protein UY42_C0016G0013 [Parcubacteria group bacterium GW2011_GWA2_49_16]